MGVTVSFCQDFSALQLADRRLSRRGVFMLDRIRQEPDLSFPSVFSSDAELEGCYRWFSNDRVQPEAILEPHLQKTKTRLKEYRRVLVLHDTTDIETAKDVGCRAHFSVAINDSCERLPIGVTSFIPILRGPREKKNRSGANEAERWREGIVRSREVLGTSEAVHVGDSEIDSYANFAEALEDKFVFRLYVDRKVSVSELENKLRISDLLSTIGTIAEREVELSPRKRGNKSVRDMKWRPLRESRTAKLTFAATSVRIFRPRSGTNVLPDTLPINIVRVLEVEAPEGELPVEWLLATNLPITTLDEVLEIVDIYRARWVIEEFFKAMKSGCSLEARMLESPHALLNAAALFVPIALDLLSLRSLAHSAPETPADVVADPLRMRVLKKFSSYKMPPNPTVGDVLLAIAKLGGHITNNGAPGWQVLGRGYKKLLMYEETWLAVLEEQKM